MERCGSQRDPPPSPLDPPYRREPGYAAHYRDRRFRSGSGPVTHRREALVLAELLATAGARPGTWLDVPCGAGRFSATLGPAVVGVDRDRTMLAAGACAVRACGSILALPFADDSFVGALCHRLLQHFPQREQRVGALAELARVTDGPIIFSYFDAATLQHARRWLRARLGRTSGRCAVWWRQLRDELHAAGLRAVTRRPLRAFFSEQTLVLARRAR